MEIPKQFDPANCEDQWYKAWEDSGAFEAHPEDGREPFVIVIPPPNVTGVLHTGHAMFVTLQDILIRWKRMKGFDALWIPGTDHAGIATQMVVAKELARQGKRREDLGRETFVKEVWKWREEKGDRILYQMKKLGASCDWSRTRFTLDRDLSNAVRKVFVDLYREGLIYRGEYMINWCPACGTALSDLEVEHQERQGKLWHVFYRLEGGAGDEGLTVATTRPETLLGDTAVAVHPDDPRYKEWIGKKVVLPILGRSIPVVGDTMVDLEFGTGAVKITPAHDPNDFEAGKRHKLDSIGILNPDGTLNENAGPFAGMGRFEARKEVVKQLEKDGLLKKTEAHTHAVGHCQRCGEVVEPTVSTQWFLKIEPLARPAREAVESGQIRIIPEHWRKVYLNWMADIHDWCISRQLWWGHRIPAWYCSSCGKAAGRDDPEKKLVSMEDLSTCPYCGGDVTRDPDVLDTWFSSQLWPFSTLGWPEETPDFNRYYPTAVMETGYDILFFWVARMIMAGLKFTGKAPFRHVFLHGLVRDAKGRKMSKTLGNVIDPLELVQRHGADAVRFTLAILCVPGTDVALDTKRMEGYRAFANKIWNAARYVLMQCGDSPAEEPAEEHLGLWDRWILGEYEALAASVNDSLESFRFYEAADDLYHFIWHKYCDWYLEASKTALSETSPAERANATRWVLVHVLEGFLRLLHPFMPFLTEELWQKIPGSHGLLIQAGYPVPNGEGRHDTGRKIEALMDFVTSIRNLRAEKGVAPKARIEVLAEAVDPAAASYLDESFEEVMFLGRLSRMELVEQLPGDASWWTGVSTGYRFAARAMEKPKDAAKELKRLQLQLDKTLSQRETFARKLANPSFLEKAPSEVVEKNRALLAEYDRKSKDLQAAIEKLT